VGIDERVDIDKDGKSIWVGERCGTRRTQRRPGLDQLVLGRAAGKMSDFDPVLKFDFHRQAGEELRRRA
jgi:hypothetical protein